MQTCSIPSPAWLSGCLVAVLSVSGCDWPGKPKPEDRPVPAEKVTDFDGLYRMHCAGCHGVDGKDGPAPPHNDPLFLAIIPEEELRRVITEGRRGTPMPAFAHDRGGPLTDRQIDILVKEMKQHWPAPRPERAPPPYLLSEAKAGDRKAGQKVFRRACAECHGKHGEGSKDSDVGAVNDPAFLALVSDQALRRLAITGRPDLGMPDYAHRDDPDFKPLTSQEINDLVALLSYWRVGGSDTDE